MEQVTQRQWDGRVFRAMRNGTFILIIALYAIGFYYIPWIAGTVLALDLLAVWILGRRRRFVMEQWEDESDDYNED